MLISISVYMCVQHLQQLICHFFTWKLHQQSRDKIFQGKSTNGINLLTQDINLKICNFYFSKRARENS